MLTDFSFSKHTVGFIIEGVFDLELSKKLHDQIEEKIKGFDKINLYLEDNNVKNFTLPAVLDECKFKIEHSNKFNKVAMVSDRKWLKICAAFENMVTTANIKWFSSEDRMKAIDWISEA